MAAGFYLACKRWPALARKPVLSGSLYGIALYVVMTYVVVPLSNAGNGGLPAWRWENLSHIAGHMLLVGIPCALGARLALRSEEHTSELQSLMRISYAVFCLKKKKKNIRTMSIVSLSQHS